MPALPVVVVDDAADLRVLIEAALQTDPRFEVVGEAGDGEQAIEAVREHRPAVVLLDVSMPRMDGLTALPRIREVSPETAVIMFSGFDERGLGATAVRLGALGFVEKSIAITELGDRVAELLGPDRFEGLAPEGDAPPLGLEAEAVLAEHLERFREVFEKAAIGMATMTLAGSIVRANAALGALAAQRPEELAGMAYRALVDLALAAELDATLQAIVAGDMEVAHLEHGLARDERVRVASTVAVVRDSRGGPLYLFLQAEDITERWTAQEALRQSEERFRLLVDSVADYAIFTLDLDGRVTSWNQGAERIKGYTADEILGQHLSVFYPPEDRTTHVHDELATARAEGRYEEEGWRVRKDGSRFWANVIITPLRGTDGEVLGFAKVTRDVTERRRILDERENIASDLALANAQLADAAVETSHFIAMMAHELSTPIAVIGGFARTLKDHWAQLSEQQRGEVFEGLSNSSGRLARLVQDLQTASRLERGVIEVDTAPVEVAPLLHTTAAGLAGAGQAEAVHIDCDPDLYADADKERLQQIVANFLTNAFRYGTPPVLVEARARDGAVEVRVIDHGPGVPDHLAPALFERFVKGAGSSGSGLGLFIVRQLARAQGGDARYEQLPAGETCFTVTLPRAGASPAEPAG